MQTVRFRLFGRYRKQFSGRLKTPVKTNVQKQFVQHPTINQSVIGFGKHFANFRVEAHVLELLGVFLFQAQQLVFENLAQHRIGQPFADFKNFRFGRI